MALYTTKSDSAVTTYTLNDFIQFKDGNNATYSNFSIFAKSITNNNLIYGISNILEEYLDDIKQYAKTIIFTKQEILRYKYKPKLLSYDIYGNTECDWVLLLLNGMCNAKEFSLYNEQLLAFTPSTLNSLLSQIMQGEATYMQMNKRYVGIITD